jgi:hypothetical protein
MQLGKILLLVIVIAFGVTSGCASYRTSSNIKSGPTSEVNPDVFVLILEGPLPDSTYKEIGPIKVRVKKLTVFHKDPTKKQANEALIEKAREIGADAVINVTYQSGLGFTTWGYMDARGMGVKLTE